MAITKSNFRDFMKCARLYDYKVKNGNNSIPMSDSVKERAELGYKYNDLAHELFNKNYKVYDARKLTYEETLNFDLKNFIKDNKYDIIREAPFYNKNDNTLCKVDFLMINKDGTVTIYEVKSSHDTKKNGDANSASIDNCWDVDFQRYVISSLNYKVAKSYIVHPNKEYVFNNTLELEKFFKFDNANKILEDSQIKDIIAEINKITTTSKEPKLIANNSCEGCPLSKHCFGELSDNSIFKAADVNKRYDIYNSGITTIEDYVKYLNSKNEIVNLKLQLQYDYLNRDDTYVNKDKLVKKLNELKYPLYYLDFETITNQIPFINGLTPGFQRIFQYSLHIQNYKGEEFDRYDEAHHKEYLQDKQGDNIKEVIDKLINDLGDDDGSIVTYHTFERDRIKGLKKFASKEQVIKLDKILSRIFDLRDVFKLSMVYNKQMRGRTTIKFILPAMVPGYEDEYKNLPLCHKGDEAMTFFNEMIDPKTSKERHEEIRKGLLQYCCLDTYAEVKIMEQLYKLIK